jgi:hypothetical protein
VGYCQQKKRDLVLNFIHMEHRMGELKKSITLISYTVDCAYDGRFKDYVSVCMCNFFLSFSLIHSLKSFSSPRSHLSRYFLFAGLHRDILSGGYQMLKRIAIESEYFLSFLIIYSQQKKTFFERLKFLLYLGWTEIVFVKYCYSLFLFPLMCVLKINFCSKLIPIKFQVCWVLKKKSHHE